MSEDIFVGELEEMDLKALHDQIFMVAINTGSRDEPKFIPESICGPLSFYEMVETVGNLYRQEMLHAKVLIPSKNFGTPPKVLNENTVDFIEARFMDIIADGLLGGEIFNEKQYTCEAGFIDYSSEQA